MTIEEIFALIRSGPEGQEKVAEYWYSDTQLINGVKKVMNGVRRRWGEDDFWSVFNLMIVGFIKRVVKDDDFFIEKNLNSYLLKIAKNLWLRQVTNKNNQLAELPQDFELTNSDEGHYALLLENRELSNWLHKLLDQIGTTCKQVLLMWASGHKMLEIMERLGFETAGNTRKRKHDCLRRLEKYLDDHPGFKELLR